MNLWHLVKSWLLPKRPRRQRDRSSKPSPYHQKLQIPASDLSDDDKRGQLWGAIRWANEPRIDELLAVDTAFMSGLPNYASRTWLSHAIHAGCPIPVLAKLLAAGGDVNGILQKTSRDKSSPLEVAIRKDRADVVKWLLDNDADPGLGRPIVGAVHYERSADAQLQILSLLLDAGANINQTFALFGKEEQRFTVLDQAELYGVDINVIEFLKSKGAKKQWSDDTTAEMQGDLKHRKIVP